MQLKMRLYGMEGFLTRRSEDAEPRKTIAQRHSVDPCLNKICVSALPAEENRNVSPCWGSPAVFVRIRPQQREK